MKLKLDSSPQLVRDDGIPVHPYNILTDWVRRMSEQRTADPKSPVFSLALDDTEWRATRSYFAQFASEAAVSPEGEDDPLRQILVAFGIEIPDPEGDEDDV